MGPGIICQKLVTGFPDPDIFDHLAAGELRTRQRVCIVFA